MIDVTESSGLVVTSPIYSSLGRRVGAFLIDGLILGVLGTLAASIVPVLGGILTWLFYAPVFESSEVRATIGKHLMGIQVADLMGRRISFKAALIRNAMKVVSAALLFIGFIFAFFNGKKQTLHDLLADTIVIYGRSERPMIDAWTSAAKDVFRNGSEKFHSVTSTSDSVVNQLERLQTLRHQGALSDAEFEAAKKRILG